MDLSSARKTCRDDQELTLPGELDKLHPGASMIKLGETSLVKASLHSMVYLVITFA